MSAFRVFDGKLVSETDLAILKPTIAEAIQNKTPISLPAGQIEPTAFTTLQLKEEATAEEAVPITFKPVGPGLPLTVEIRFLYTGRYPSNILSHPRDMLLSSSLKNLDLFDAAVEAVNFLIAQVNSRSGFSAPPADKNGTALVYYSPAVTTIKSVVTFNLIFQNFNSAVLDKISGVFSGVAGIPIFMAAAPYLIGAKAVLKLAGDVGNQLFNGKPDFAITYTINFSDPGDPVQDAGFVVLFKEDEDPDTNPQKLTFDSRRGLVDASNQPYKGPAPYIVISIDGTQQDSLKSFAPTAASAALMSKFFNAQDGDTIPTQDILDALQALNDVKFSQKAADLQKQIASASADQKAALESQLKAVAANIQNDALKPKTN
jgi:hypothetical protein